MNNTPKLEQTWRWFGPADPTPLSYIRQAGATGVVTALHHVPCGQVWSLEEIRRRKAEIESAGLRWSVVESVAVHEQIKQGRHGREAWLENYRQSLRNLAACGIHIICYNFMALTDWTRTHVAMKLASGAEALRFDATDFAAFDLHILARPGAEKDYSPEVRARAQARFRQMSDAEKAALEKTILLGLPGTVEDFTPADFRNRLREYDGIDSDVLRENHAWFMRGILPVAQELGMRMAIHPDDPPFPIFGLPRIACTGDDLAKLFAVVDSRVNGLTFCTGSLGANPANDLPMLLEKFGDRTHFLHFRSVKREADGSFFEDDHLAGSTDMAAIMLSAMRVMERRGQSLPMRPDHGHRMLNDLSRSGFYAGYSCIGRLRGLAELRGLEHGLRHVSGK